MLLRNLQEQSALLSTFVVPENVKQHLRVENKKYIRILLHYCKILHMKFLG